MSAPGRHTPRFYANDEPPCCARCGSSMDWERCSQCGGEGGHDAYELSPIEYEPGEVIPCGLCLGTGGWWCCLSSAEWCEANPLPEHAA